MHSFSRRRVNKTAQAALALLVDPKFIFWATHLRFFYRLVYKKAFDEVQFNHHRNAPALSGAAGPPVAWARAARGAVKQPGRANAKPQLDATVCAPLIKLLERHKCLGGLKGEAAAVAVHDLLAQADYWTTSSPTLRAGTRWRRSSTRSHAR